MVLPRLHFFRIREPSLPRGVLLSLGAFVVSLRLAGFPYIERLHGSRWQLVAVPFACWGMLETVRCIRKKWDLYHAGVMILLYAELMILATALALWALL